MKKKRLLGALVIAPLIVIVLVFVSIFGIAAIDSSNCDTFVTDGQTIRINEKELEGISVPGFDSEQIMNAALIVKAGADRNLSRRDQTLAVITAIGESTLRILDYGDIAGPDSRGLFQQRDSWGPLADRMDAYKSAGLFYDQLVLIDGRETMSETLAIHSVQRNADPNHYTRFVSQGQAIISALSGKKLTATTSTGSKPTTKVVQLTQKYSPTSSQNPSPQQAQQLIQSAITNYKNNQEPGTTSWIWIKNPQKLQQIGQLITLQSKSPKYSNQQSRSQQAQP